MRFVVAVALAAVAFSAGTALAQGTSTQDTSPRPAGVPGAADARSTPPISGRSEADEAVERVRENLRRSAGTSNPFPYAVSVDPPREPYRRPVPCSTFARETDGTTTCIGTQERASGTPRTAARAAPKQPARATANVRPRPVVREPVFVERRLTDPRYDLPPVSVAPPIDQSDGLLAFLGRVFSR